MVMSLYHKLSLTYFGPTYHISHHGPWSDILPVTNLMILHLTFISTVSIAVTQFDDTTFNFHLNSLHCSYLHFMSYNSHHFLTVTQPHRLTLDAELKVGIFAQRAMVDQARQGLCYQKET